MVKAKKNVKKKVVKVVKKKVIAKKVTKKLKPLLKKKCDICGHEAPLAPVFSYDLCADCYFLAEPYFDNLVREVLKDGKES